ncbi:MAG TPA: hypothetical protein VIV11_18675 [Kofleriaceae bacterium]
MRVLALVLVSGCSFAFVRGPVRDRAPDEPVECTTTAAAPVVDTIVFMAASAAFITTTLEPPREPDPLGLAEVIHRGTQSMSLTAALFASGSAIYGLVMIERCLCAIRNSRDAP